MSNKNMGIITNSMIKAFKKEFLRSSHNKIMMDAVTNTSVSDVAMNRQSLINMDFTFSNEIKTGKITYQKHSGRCWIFAGTNTLRIYLMRKLNLEQFELSQSYPFFFDKLEKSNYFLENIIETIDDDIRDRTVMWLLKSPIGDGGQWDMFINLVEKYGIVPKNIYPETYNSSNSGMLNKLLTQKLREFASALRKMRRNGKKIQEIRKEKDRMIGEVYKFLAISFGIPPEKFDFEYRDKKEKFHRVKGLTPKEFYKEFIGLDLRDYVSIINAPMEDKEFQKTHRDKGIMDVNLYDYSLVFDTGFKWDKGERLDYGESRLTHAMVFTGVNLFDGKPNRWKVENSWGKDVGDKGFFVMSDQWFDEFLYQVVINKKYIPEKIKKLLKKKPSILPPWDPMGSLAIMV